MNEKRTIIMWSNGKSVGRTHDPPRGATPIKTTVTKIETKLVE